jgi:hypothetical protein
MRVAGTECDASGYREAAGLEFALREWLGDANSGQLGYFRRKGDQRVRRFRRAERGAQVSFWVGFAILAFFILMTTEMEDVLRDPVIVLMGIMLLVVGVGQSYSVSVADGELIKQYEFMFRIFSNARRRIDATQDDEEKRRILRILGEAALGEHAQWILMHREKSLEQGEIFRMGGG